MYELGIRHSIGLPTIMVRHKNSKLGWFRKQTEHVPFDVTHYRHLVLDLDDSAAAREAIEETVHSALAEMRNPGPQGKFDNPVTEYYKGWPMIEGSPTAGLALGYYTNMVKRTAKALSSTDAKAFLRDENKRPVRELAIDQIERLNVYIPRDLQASTNYADTFRKKSNAQNLEITTTKGRPVETYFVEEDHALLDIPTTLGAINKAVRRRVPDDPGLASEIARFVTSRELDRFDSALKRLIEDENDPNEDDDVIAFLKNRVAFYDLWTDSSGRVTPKLTLERVSKPQGR
ncbi:hypothetical protein A5753_13500 [Mycobacterium sp. 852002-51971_SCH5477799-a]|nr:hypothetical protein A5753_13500 [Mycobacterium sp. 852002-51971_SCH5477799-a]